jgi:rRNA pseudouridine-1189 N-methylase Emg1 (Nep1/Mra1 family)
VTNTSENLDRFLDTFDELFKKVDFLSKKSNTLAALYNHDIRDSIQYIYPASHKE